jgi:guanylate kinase
VWILDHRGLQQMQQLFPSDVVCVFLWGYVADLSNRMARRGDSDASINQRLARFEDELALGVKYYQPSVINTTCMTAQQVAERIRTVLGV